MLNLARLLAFLCFIAVLAGCSSEESAEETLDAGGQDTTSGSGAGTEVSWVCEDLIVLDGETATCYPGEDADECTQASDDSVVLFWWSVLLWCVDEEVPAWEDRKK